MFRWSKSAMRLAWLLVAATVVGIVAVLLADTITLLSLFVLFPTIAALSLGAGATALVAGYSIGWGLVISIVAHVFSGAGRGTGFITVCLASIIAVGAAQKWQRREATLRRISLVAEAAQATIVRPIPSQLGALTFATVYRSAAEEARVGGDAYAAVAYPGGVRLLIADVRGKGLEAVGLAADVLGSFREFAPGPVHLVEVAFHLERAIMPSLGPEDFVTALLVDFTADKIGLVSCGHPWPLLRQGGTVREVVIEQPSRPLGLGIRPLQQNHPFGPGDQLFVFTDGLIEARNRFGSYFEPLDVLAGLPENCPPREVLDTLISRLDEHAGGRLADDLAIVLAEYTTEPVTSLIEGVRVLAGEEVTNA